jgi:hypothetical protein
MSLPPSSVKACVIGTKKGMHIVTVQVVCVEYGLPTQRKCDILRIGLPALKALFEIASVNKLS